MDPRPIGVVDSGIWPESKSFSDRDATGKLIYQQIPGWHGKCTPGEGFNASMCNQKLIGGQHFNASWGGDAALEALRPWEFMSVRDYNGHGTHTASTSGGNNGVAATGVDTSTPLDRLVLPAIAPLGAATNTRQVSLNEQESATVFVTTEHHFDAADDLARSGLRHGERYGPSGPHRLV